MSVKDIRLFGDPILRTPAVAVVDFDRELRLLVQDLTDTMLDAPGAGLAAPQIGVGLRVFTYHVDERSRSPGQPEPATCPRSARTARRGACRSPGVVFDTPRALRVVATGFDSTASR